MVALIEAARLARVNRAQIEELEDRHDALLRRAERERLAQEARRREVYDDFLVPFRDVFARLKNVDLDELVDIDVSTAHTTPQIEVTRVRLTALHAVGALAGGLSAGAGAGVGAFTTVGLLATASTGTSISALSGAAATSATLAWLGGGSLAAGGGGVAAGSLVLGGLVVAPVLAVTVGVVSWQGRRQRRRQRETAEELALAETELVRAEQNTTAVLVRSRQVRTLLADLGAAAGAPVAQFRTIVDGTDDYSSYSTAQRALVATLVGLATTTIAVMSTPLADEDGLVTELSGQVGNDARRRLDELSGDFGTAL